MYDPDIILFGNVNDFLEEVEINGGLKEDLTNRRNGSGNAVAVEGKGKVVPFDGAKGAKGKRAKARKTKS